LNRASPASEISGLQPQLQDCDARENGEQSPVLQDGSQNRRKEPCNHPGMSRFAKGRALALRIARTIVSACAIASVCLRAVAPPGSVHILIIGIHAKSFTG